MAEQPKLTVGMAVYDDFDGAYFTLQALRLYHDLTSVEIVVVDNNPESKSGKLLANLVQYKNLAHRTAGVRYIPYPEPVGTTAPRQRVFEEARGDVVMCIDSHVLLSPGSIGRLLDWYSSRGDCADLLSGPMLYDDFASAPTHFNDQWRSEMWGTWGQAWTCRCGQEGTHFYIAPDLQGKAEFFRLAMGHTQIKGCERCGEAFPEGIGYAGHEKPLRETGYRQLGVEPDDPPFDIPGQGLGLFVCKRDAWLGFNRHFRGFGGEEMYIHEKFRKAGRRCLSMPFLKWGHRFGRIDGVKYPLTRYNKVRNYVLGHQEVGLPLTRVYKHFVSLEFDHGSLKEHLVLEHGISPASVNGRSDQELQQLHQAHKLRESDWEYLLQDPIAHSHPKRSAATTANAESAPAPAPAIVKSTPEQTLQDVFKSLVKQPRDLDQHMELLKELASQCEVVEEVTRRKESTVALLAGQPKTLKTHIYSDDATHPLVHGLRGISGKTELSIEAAREAVSWEVDNCDLLFCKTPHLYANLAADLEKWSPKVRRWIAIHGTTPENHEDGSPGLPTAMRTFLKSHPEWFIYSHAPQQWGLTVLGRLPADRPAVPVHAWRPDHGPGTELSAMLKTLGINPGPTCDCRAKAAQMDLWGTAVCREKREVIIGWMRDGQDRWGWRSKVSAAGAAVMSGLAFKLNPLDPFPGLIDEAIRRAEAKENKSANV